MSADSFLDTNIIIYLFDDTDERKQSAAKSIVIRALSERNCCISQQVVQESLNVLFNKLNMESAEVLKFFNTTLNPLSRPISNVALNSRAIEIKARYRYSFYDSLIIASALELNCGLLFSEDLQHQQKIGSLTLINPFL